MLKRKKLLFLIAASAATTAMGATYPQPIPSGFTPTSGPPGTVITITGTGFTGLSQVWIGNAHDSSVYVVNDTTVKVTVPADATTAHLGLLNPQHSDFTDDNFTVTKGGTPPPPPPPPAGSTSVSGAVTGPKSASMTMTGRKTRVEGLNADGGYKFTGVTSGLYTVTPTTAGHVFTPTSIAATVADTPLTHVNFAGSPTSAPTYRLSGTAGGSDGADVKITLNGKNVGSVSTDESGTYSFAGLPAGKYTVSAEAHGHTFSESRTVKLEDQDVIEENFTSVSTASGSAIKLTAVSPLPTATMGQSYSTSVLKHVSGGKGSYYYQSGSYSTGAPPVGMVLNKNGTLSGTPTTAGKYTFELCASDTAGDTTDKCASTELTVESGSGSSPIPSGTSWVYYNGVFDWPGDYSYDLTPDYTDDGGGPLSGPYDIKATLNSAWGGWLPYAKNWDFDSNGYTKLTFALKPTVANQVWWVYFVKKGDKPVGIYLDVSKYGPAPEVGVWATYTVPLSDLGVLGTDIYKFCIQDQTGLSSNTWFIDNVGFEP